MTYNARARGRDLARIFRPWVSLATPTRKGATPMPDPVSTVQGKCPACGGPSLFLGEGGYITCSRTDCQNPAAADDLLHGEHTFVRKDWHEGKVRAEVAAEIRAVGEGDDLLGRLLRLDTPGAQFAREALAVAAVIAEGTPDA